MWREFRGIFCFIVLLIGIFTIACYHINMPLSHCCTDRSWYIFNFDTFYYVFASYRFYCVCFYIKQVEQSRLNVTLCINIFEIRIKWIKQKPCFSDIYIPYIYIYIYIYKYICSYLWFNYELQRHTMHHINLNGTVEIWKHTAPCIAKKVKR